jgi:putative inorganic carbon (hco3(-)) transporter
MAMLLLTSFFICYFTHLTARVDALGAMRLDLVLGVGAFLTTFMQPVSDKLRLGIPTSRRLMIFLAYIIISLPLVTWPGSVINNNLTVWIKSAFFFLLVVGAVRSEGQLKWIMLVFLACQAFRVLEPLYLHITEGYWGDIAYSHSGGSMSGLNRLSGAPKDIVNANQFAWVIINTIPFMFYLFWQGTKLGKLTFLAAIPPFVYALFLTGSRSGIISLGVVVLGIVYISEKRARNLMLAMLIVIPAAIYMFSSADSGLQDRYLSLVDSSVAGADTKQGRIDALFKQLGSISHNPLFGNGLGTSGETNANILGGSSQITHNMYIEILQETGIVGFSLFMAYIVTMIKSLAHARNTLKKLNCDDSDWLLRLVSATIVWIIMDLVYSISCFGVSSWEWYFFGGIATVCLAMVNEKLENDQQTTSGVCK